MKLTTGVGALGKDARFTRSRHRTAVDNAVQFYNTATPSVEGTVQRECWEVFQV